MPSAPITTPMTVVELVNWRATVGAYVETAVMASASPKVGSPSSASRRRSELERERSLRVAVATHRLYPLSPPPTA